MTELVWGVDGRGEHHTRGTKTPRSLSYTGCWTCRERRVKCDERPGSCAVCSEAKLKCAGYDVRLIWKAGKGARARHQPRTSRRQIKLDQNSCRLMTEHEVMQTITKIDRSEARPAATTLGPFSVFSIQSPRSPESPTSDAEAEMIVEQEASPLNEAMLHNKESSSPDQSNELNYTLWNESMMTDDAFERLDALGTSMATSSDATDSFASQTDNDPNYSEAGLVRSSIQAPSPMSFDEILLYSPPVVHAASRAIGPLSLVSSSARNIAMTLEGDAPAFQSSDMSIGHNQRQTRRLSDAGNFLHSSPLMNPDIGRSINIAGSNATADMLIHHYAKHMVHLMQPVSHQANPFRTIYLPLAIEGSPNVEIVYPSDRVYSASVTVFHSLMAMAAIHLQSVQSRGESLQRLACHHKQRALIALRSALATRSSNYKDLMTAILSLVSADIIDGGTNDHWIHLEAAIQLQASRHYARFVSRETRQLNSICRMLHLFAQTAQPQPEPKPWPGVKHVPSDAHPDFLEPSIEFIYGITTSVAGAILKIYQLVPYIAYYNDEEYPESLMQECEALGDTLCSWSIDSEPFSAIDPQQENMLKVARAQARAFYYAALIYYYRSIQGCSRESLHGEQQAAIAAMNEAEDLKGEFGEDGSLPAPITWPAFIASCEAVGDDRQDWENWWSRVQKYHMGNYSKQQTIIQRVWAECESNETLGEWRDELAAMNLRIIPV